MFVLSIKFWSYKHGGSKIFVTCVCVCVRMCVSICVCQATLDAASCWDDCLTFTPATLRHGALKCNDLFFFLYVKMCTVKGRVLCLIALSVLLSVKSMLIVTSVFLREINMNFNLLWQSHESWCGVCADILKDVKCQWTDPVFLTAHFYAYDLSDFIRFLNHGDNTGKLNLFVVLSCVFYLFHPTRTFLHQSQSRRN